MTDKRSRTLSLPLIACAIIALLWPFSFFFRVRVHTIIDRKEATFFVGPKYLWLNLGTTPSIERSFTSTFKRNTAYDRDFLAAPMVFTTTNSYTFWFPLSLLVVAVAIFATGLIVSRYRRLATGLIVSRYGGFAMFKPGGCPRCGYDLRATPDRCPECGYSPVTRINSTEPGRVGPNE